MAQRQSRFSPINESCIEKLQVVPYASFYASAGFFSSHSLQQYDPRAADQSGCGVYLRPFPANKGISNPKNKLKDLSDYTNKRRPSCVVQTCTRRNYGRLELSGNRAVCMAVGHSITRCSRWDTKCAAISIFAFELSARWALVGVSQRLDNHCPTRHIRPA